jgi:hypothetical protein
MVHYYSFGADNITGIVAVEENLGLGLMDMELQTHQQE